MKVWFVPMADDTRTFETAEGPITVARHDIATVWFNPDRPEWTEISFSGRVRVVREAADTIIKWVRAGGSA